MKAGGCGWDSPRSPHRGRLVFASSPLPRAHPRAATAGAVGGARAEGEERVYAAEVAEVAGAAQASVAGNPRKRWEAVAAGSAGLGSAGLGSAGLGSGCRKRWVMQCWDMQCWVRQRWVRQCWVRQCWVRQCWNMQCWVRQCWVRQCWVRQCWVRQCWVRQSWVGAAGSGGLVPHPPAAA